MPDSLGRGKAHGTHLSIIMPRILRPRKDVEAKKGSGESVQDRANSTAVASPPQSAVLRHAAQGSRGEWSESPAAGHPKASRRPDWSPLPRDVEDRFMA